MKPESGELWLVTNPGKHTFDLVTVRDVTMTRVVLNGKWRVYFYDGNGVWWEDNNLLADDDFWSMLARLRDGKWRII